MRFKKFDSAFYNCRVINFVDEMVQTLAGNGIKGSDYKGGRKGNSQAGFMISAHICLLLIEIRIKMC